MMIVALLVVLGYLIHLKRDDELIREYIIAKETEENIVIEGVLEKESFKPKDHTQEEVVEIADDQENGISEVDTEVVEVDVKDDESYKPPNVESEKVVNDTNSEIVEGNVEEVVEQEMEDTEKVT